MSIKEMKDILYQKLKDENCCFKKDDISIASENGVTTIFIKDYEHIPFEITEEKDDVFGYVLWVKELCDGEVIEMIDSSKGYLYRDALITIGYYIGTRF